MDKRGENATPGLSITAIAGCDALVKPGELRKNVDIVIQGDSILEIRSASGTIPDGPGALDGSGLLALPGLINAHTHSTENPLRGLGEGLRLEPWLLLMLGSAGSYTPEDHYVCALAGAVEMLKAGTTATIDHLWMTPPSIEATEAALRAYRDVGLRAAVAPLMEDCDYTEEYAAAHGLSLGNASMIAGRPPISADKLVEQVATLMDRWHGTCGGRLKVFAGPGGIQWCSEDLLTSLAQLAQERRSGLQIHALETQLQREVCRHRFKQSGVKALDALGVLGPEVSLSHAIWIDRDDIAVIAERGAIPVHNPTANLRLGSGRAPIPAFCDARVTVALGTDGSAASDNQDLWDVLKLTTLLHNDGESWLRAADALAMATTGGAAALGERHRLGTLEPKALADIVLLDRRSPKLIGAQEIEPTLTLSDCGAGVRHVLVNGQLILRDCQCLTVDEQEVFNGLANQTAQRHDSVRHPSASTQSAIRTMETLLTRVY